MVGFPKTGHISVIALLGVYPMATTVFYKAERFSEIFYTSENDFHRINSAILGINCTRKTVIALLTMLLHILIMCHLIDTPTFATTYIIWYGIAGLGNKIW